MSRRLQILIIYFVAIALRIGYGYVAIEQCPGSDVPRIRQQTQHHEISLIFYYTKWSNDSLEALNQYNDVAVYYSDKIYFAAIDCWHLACNCTRASSAGVGSGLPHKWPTLMAFYGRRGQLQMQYHGLWSFKDIQQFIDNLLNPLERLHTREELEELKLISDAVVIGIFETPDCREYKHYLMTSLKWLESDPLRTYRFMVTFATNKTTASEWHKDAKVPDLIFIGASDTKRFREVRDHVWNASNILLWLHRELKADLSRLHGYATPISIAQKLNQNAVLAIFVNDPQRFFSYMEPLVYLKRPSSTIASECSRLMKTTTLNGYFEAFRIKHILGNLKVYSDHDKCYCNIAIIFKHIEYYYEINKYLDTLLPKLAYPFKKMQNIKPHIVELLKLHHLTRCLNSDVSSSNSLQIGVVKQLQTMVDSDMLLYKSNRTMSVVLLDSERYKDYLQNIDVMPQPKSMATSFIIDRKHESTFIMKDNFSVENLKEFIHQFCRQTAMPHFKSEHIHPVSTSTRRSAISPENYKLENLNRFMFLNHLHYAHNQTIVLLIHSPECLLCGTLQHTFIQLAASLRQLSPELKFVRINALLNDLPWQFNMASVPALLIFPKNHFGETRLFPSHLKPDVRSVFSFMLNQLTPEDQMKIVVTFCQNQALSSNHSQSCWQFAKTLLMQHIGKHLHYWQLFENERSLIFERLRAFKDMSLDVQRNLRL